MEETTNKKQKIAVIEDDQVLSRSIAGELEDAGYAVVQAFDGEGGLALVLKEKPDLVLLDVLLPKMDGLLVLEKLRQDPWGKSVPVIVLTNLSEPWDVAATALAGGVHDYLIKVDWTVADVVKKVEERLKTVSPPLK
ncbi:MAG: response regulator [bacterium]|nr:response regulator [bacterium]